MSALELGRLFSLVQEGVDPENFFNAALLRMAGGSVGGNGGDLGGIGGLGALGSFSLPPGMSLASIPAGALPLPLGLEGLAASNMDDGAGGAGGGGMKSAASCGMGEGDGSTDDEDEDRGSVGGTTGTGGGAGNPPPRTGSISDHRCTKVLPASSSAPKYKFVVPNEYVYKFMKHLVERPFHMRDGTGKLWDCVLIQRKNKEKYEYMIQGWRRFGESMGVQEGDTVTIEMANDSVLQLTLERTGGTAGNGGGKKRPRPAGNGGGGGAHPTASQGGAPGAAYAVERQQLMQAAAATAAAAFKMERDDGGGAEDAGEQALLAAQNALLGPAMAGVQQVGGLGGQAGGGGVHGMQQETQQVQQAQQQHQYGALLDGVGGNPGSNGPQELLNLIQQHQQQQAAQQAAAAALAHPPPQQGTPQPVLTPRSLTHQLANGLGGHGLGSSGAINEAQLADLTAMINQLDKRQRLEAPPGAPGSGGSVGGHQGAPLAAGAVGSGGPGGNGAIRLLSDVADLDHLVQQHQMLREQLRLAEAKIATLETGVLNIKSVLTRNTDPGLIAMTGVINLLNQIESSDFLPELGTLGRMTLTGLCSEVRRHLNGVLRMVWILRSLPDDVQQHNSGSAGGGAGSGMPGPHGDNSGG